MDAAQECLPHTLPLAVEFSDDGLAWRKAWRAFHGLEARRVLHRVLLVSDGAAVCCGRNEYVVGGGDRRFCAAGKSCAQGNVGGENSGGVARRVGSVGD